MQWLYRKWQNKRSYECIKEERRKYLNSSKGVWNLTITVDVRVHNTMNVLKLLRNYQRHCVVIITTETTFIRNASPEVTFNKQAELSDATPTINAETSVTRGLRPYRLAMNTISEHRAGQRKSGSLFFLKDTSAWRQGLRPISTKIPSQISLFKASAS